MSRSHRHARWWRFRTVFHVSLAGCVVAIAGCGDGINEGVNEGRAPRGTIDGVTLEPVESIDISIPEPVAVDDPFGEFNPDPDTTDPDEPSAEPDDSVFGWLEIEDGIDDGYLDVPVDPQDPTGETITLYLVRHRAADPGQRIGTLLVHPGGPGLLGADLAYLADDVFGQEILDRFDVIGWDARGVGFEDHYVDCDIDYYSTFGEDTSPDSDVERLALEARLTTFTDGCAEFADYLLPHLGLSAQAADVEAIRDALGEDTISFYGRGYGSQVGAAWAAQHPDSVRALVLDGADNPTSTHFDSSIQRAAAAEAALTSWLDDCSASPACAFSNDGDAAAAFDELDLTVEEDKVFGFRAVTHGVFHSAVIYGLQAEERWASLEQALADAQDGDWDGIDQLFRDAYEIDGELGDNRTDTAEAFYAITCADRGRQLTIDEVFARQGELAAAAPRLGRHWMFELSVCATWPFANVPAPVIAGIDVGPAVVIATTGDLVTPPSGAEAMAAAFVDGRVITVVANQHTGYGVNPCVSDAVDTYLVSPTNPPDRTLTCA